MKAKEVKKVAILAVLALLMVLGGGQALAATLVVDDDLACPGAGYTTVQSAINDANPGDTVLVCQGTYGESVVIGTKNLTLTGLPGAKLDGTSLVGTATSVFGITLADGVAGVVIQGFAIQNYKGDDSGSDRSSAIMAWDVSTSRITVRDNKLLNNKWNGILVGSEGGYIHKRWRVNSNTLADNGFAGIELTNCSNCIIRNNDIDPSLFGIVIQARNTVAGSGNVTIRKVGVLNNSVDDATYGIYILSLTGHPTAFTPIAGASSVLRGVKVKSNTVTDSTSTGIIFWAYNNAARAEKSVIMKNSIECLPDDNPGIQILERGQSGERGTVEKVKVLNNTIDNDCDPAIKFD